MRIHNDQDRVIVVVREPLGEFYALAPGGGFEVRGELDDFEDTEVGDHVVTLWGLNLRYFHYGLELAGHPADEPVAELEVNDEKRIAELNKLADFMKHRGTLDGLVAAAIIQSLVFEGHPEATSIASKFIDDHDATVRDCARHAVGLQCATG